METHTVCFTPDGLLLRLVVDGETVMQARSVNYARQPAERFQVPPSFTRPLNREAIRGFERAYRVRRRRAWGPQDLVPNSASCRTLRSLTRCGVNKFEKLASIRFRQNWTVKKVVPEALCAKKCNAGKSGALNLSMRREFFAPSRL